MPSPRSSSSKSSRSRQVDATSQVSVTYQLKHLLALPPGYEKNAKKRWPLVVFLHGSGERGDSLAALRGTGLSAVVEQGKTFPFILLTPLCPRYEWWNVRAVEALITDISQRYQVDLDRIYLTGLSMGGFGVWELAARDPGRYAALAPICGGGHVEWAPKLANLPIWVFHGMLDQVVPVWKSQEMVNALRAAGGHPQLTLYPEVFHDAWTQTYANDAFYRWMLKQRRGK